MEDTVIVEDYGKYHVYLSINITDMPKEHCCSVLFISKTHAKNISVLPKKQLSRFKKVIRLVQI